MTACRTTTFLPAKASHFAGDDAEAFILAAERYLPVAIISFIDDKA